MRIGDWSSDVCSSDLLALARPPQRHRRAAISAHPAGLAKTISEPKAGLATAKLAGPADRPRSIPRPFAQIEPAAERPARKLALDPEGRPLSRRSELGRAADRERVMQYV